MGFVDGVRGDASEREGWAMVKFRVKICGIMQPDQGAAIARAGATALGFICVAASPRYVTPGQIKAILDALPPEAPVDCVGVFANADADDITHVVRTAGLTAVQLHGDEPPALCAALRERLPGLELIKAFRVRDADTLAAAIAYGPHVDTLLLDAYRPGVLGGTGDTLDWDQLQNFRPPCPWLLAGGLTPENAPRAIARAHPDGIDLSSGLERSPGDKDLGRVRDLFRAVRAMAPRSHPIPQTPRT